MININLDAVQEAGNGTKQPKAGSYVGVINMLENNADKMYLKLYLDIAEGEFKDYYLNLYDSKDFWGLTTFRSYKEKALPFFKAFIKTVEACNPKYKWNGDETKLKGKKVGMKLVEETYTKADGSEGTRLTVESFTDLKAVDPANEEFMKVSDTEGIPFK